MVRTAPFHGVNRGSIPLGAANHKNTHHSGECFCDYGRGIEQKEGSGGGNVLPCRKKLETEGV